MTKALTTKAKASPAPAAGFRQMMDKRNRAIVEAHARGTPGLALAKKYKMSSARTYQILRDAKLKKREVKSAAKPAAKGTVIASPVGRAQTLLVQMAVLKEAVRHALNSPKAKFTPKLGDEILGALASARTAEIAVKEASERLEMVKKRLEGQLVSGKMNGVALGWKAVARAARLKASSKSAKA